MSAVVLPTGRDAAATVVMPVYGARDEVEHSLRALVANTTLPFDTVIVDNASPDGTTDWLRTEVRGGLRIDNPQNLGFGAACNQGANAATTEIVVFLNSDAAVEPGWLDALVETCALPGAAAASARLHHPDGRLQEAGALIDRNGVGVAYGNTHDPSAFRFRFRRTVDYASGTCLAVRRSVFLAHGGFDAAFGLAYCEDVDLSLRFQASGWSTYYEPRAVAVHVQGASSPPAHVVRLRDHNTTILRERYAHLLAARPPLRDLLIYPYRTVTSRDACAPDRLLVLTCTLPKLDTPLGGFLSTLATLRPDARIAVLTPDRVAPGPEVDAWLARGVEIAEDTVGVPVWCRDRIGVYGTVIIADGAAERALASVVRRTQPQAEWRRFDGAPATAALLADLGWAPPAADPAREPRADAG